MFALGALAIAPVGAQQMESIDPDNVYEQAPGDTGAIDADIAPPSSAQTPPYRAPVPSQSQEGPATVNRDAAPGAAYDPDLRANAQAEGSASDAEIAEDAGRQTYAEDDLIGAAEGLFGEGAEGLARLIEDLLREQGEPNGYIVGREAGGAFIFGARYGSGTLHHQVEGQRKVYWTGPSLGFDAGANAGNTFVLVYNLYDTEDLFRRYPAGEGQAYLVGGLHASYMRRGDVVLIPIRLGAGLRLGVNAGYMRFSKEQRWLPF